MVNIIDKSALAKWDNSKITLENYTEYIDKKNDKYCLTLIDLLYISNFKGGNASIHEKESKLNIKLKKYSEILRKIKMEFYEKKLSELTDFEFKNIEIIIKEIIEICYDKKTSINGFKLSYLSALIHAYFPNLFPILDRRILINLKIVDENNLDSQNQVKNIKIYYLPLIYKIREISKNEKQSIRDIDKEYFIQLFPDSVKKKKKTQRDFELIL